ncbi:MAG: DUF488 domain-containing protein [Anaerolineales bacterium]|nr:DUF488 domain-containing protein [Anaerolineales bacterium]
MIHIQRVYGDQGDSKGRRYLVERLWPRGVRKEALPLDGWLKEIAPSTELRQWFAHDPEKWPEFRRRYWKELEANPAAWQTLLKTARRGAVTLLYSARDTEHNGALVLKAFLDQQLTAAR